MEIVSSTSSSVPSPAIQETSRPYLGQWHMLVSSTNWEKGKIIASWRDKLIAAAKKDSAIDRADYSDEAWAQLVGNVTPQHVGRLRRVHERFAAVRESYAGLYWSHFQAALDWNDAEMWLEGAVQNKWSIADMRAQRSEALGAVETIVADERGQDEDWDSSPDGSTETAPWEGEQATLAAVRPLERDEDEEDEDVSAEADDDEDSRKPAPAETPEPRRATLASLPSLPADVTDAFESFKLCILRHKLAGWSDISRADLLASLDALKELALAQAD